jgi:hypothetical protein
MNTVTLEYPVKNPKCKTARIRGATWKFILSKASKKPVTWRDLIPPLPNRAIASSNLQKLYECGKLDRIRRGGSGVLAQPSKYILKPNHET